MIVVLSKVIRFLMLEFNNNSSENLKILTHTMNKNDSLKLE